MMSRSSTGVTELDREATILSTNGHTIRALQLNRRALKIRLHHVDVAPFISLIDVAGSHRAVAGDLVNIIARLNGADQALYTNYRA